MIRKFGPYLVLGAICVGYFSQKETSATPVKVAAPPPSPESIKAEAEFQAAVVVARALKRSMKNPDSFKLEQVLRMADGSLCFSYRATNSFNAIIPGYAVQSGEKFLASGSDGFRSLWARKCAHKSGDDLTHVRRAI